MRRSTILQVLQLLFTVLAFAAFAMLYWSSLLVEEDLQKIKRELKEYQAQPLQKIEKTQTEAKTSPALAGDPLAPNLLTPDPFYEKELPKLLPKDFVPYGVLQGATIGVPANLHPFSQFADVNGYIGLCTLSVTRNHFGVYETYAPYAAVKMEEKYLDDQDAVEYWIYLRDDIDWQPLRQEWFSFALNEWFLKKHPVTAHDFKLQYDAFMNPFITVDLAITLRQFYDDVLEFRVVDDRTFVLKWKTYAANDGKKHPKYRAKGLSAALSPLASFVYLYYPDGSKIVEASSYKDNSTWAQLFQEHWAKNIIPSCGPYQFESKNEHGISFKRNPDHFEPLDALVEGRYVEFKIGQENLWQSFKMGKLDTYNMPPNETQDWLQFKKTVPGRFSEINYPGNSFTYIGWNQKRPLFQSRKVRQAMTYAINRPRLIREIMEGKGNELSCPFSFYSEAYDKALEPYPFDLDKAKALLKEEGFEDYDGDGVLEKRTGEGEIKCAFTLTYFVKNSVTKAFCEAIATQLKEIGVLCNLNGVDIADISAIINDKDFDAYYLAWAKSAPPEDLSQLWHSSGASVKGSSNTIGFVNAEVDKIIHELEYEYVPAKRTELYHRFDRIFYDEQPYTLLYSPISSLLYKNEVQNVFLPVDRKDLIPKANVSEPSSSIFWLKRE